MGQRGIAQPGGIAVRNAVRGERGALGGGAATVSGDRPMPGGRRVPGPGRFEGVPHRGSGGRSSARGGPLPARARCQRDMPVGRREASPAGARAAGPWPVRPKAQVGSGERGGGRGCGPASRPRAGRPPFDPEPDPRAEPPPRPAGPRRLVCRRQHPYADAKLTRCAHRDRTGLRRPTGYGRAYGRGARSAARPPEPIPGHGSALPRPPLPAGLRDVLPFGRCGITMSDRGPVGHASRVRVRGRKVVATCRWGL